MKGVTHRLDCIVRNGESLHQDIADIELGAGAKDAPVPVIAQSETANGVGGLSVAINGNGKSPAKDFEATDVVAVFMGEKEAIELLKLKEKPEWAGIPVVLSKVETPWKRSILSASAGP